MYVKTKGGGLGAYTTSKRGATDARGRVDGARPGTLAAAATAAAAAAATAATAANAATATAAAAAVIVAMVVVFARIVLGRRCLASHKAEKHAPHRLEHVRVADEAAVAGRGLQVAGRLGRKAVLPVALVAARAARAVVRCTSESKSMVRLSGGTSAGTERPVHNGPLKKHKRLFSLMRPVPLLKTWWSSTPIGWFTRCMPRISDAWYPTSLYLPNVRQPCGNRAATISARTMQK